MNQAEKRCYGGQNFRAADSGNGKIIEGHAAVFEQIADIDGVFFEIIERGAFTDTDFYDVPLFVNHDCWQIPLARSRLNNGKSSMSLTVDDTGLAVRACLDVDNNPAAKTLYASVERGDLDGMSFAFSVDNEEWLNLDSDMPTRRIKKIGKVFEVSAVNYPAYNTDIHTRALNALENAKRALGNARDSVELYKLKNRILGGF